VTQAPKRLDLGGGLGAALNFVLSADSVVDAVHQVTQGGENLVETGRLGEVHIPRYLGITAQCG
jgi:hypothetical protein